MNSNNRSFFYFILLCLYWLYQLMLLSVGDWKIWSVDDARKQRTSHCGCGSNCGNANLLHESILTRGNQGICHLPLAWHIDLFADVWHILIRICTQLFSCYPSYRCAYNRKKTSPQLSMSPRFFTTYSILRPLGTNSFLIFFNLSRSLN